MARAVKPKKVNKPHHPALYKQKKVPVRLAYHKHTGRMLPFYCTSYAVVFFLLCFATMSIIFATSLVAADQQNSGSVFISGEVRGAAPETAAVINTPHNNDHFTNTQVLITGNCMEDKYVEIYRGNDFLGMTYCDSLGEFSITVTLIPGENVLIAKIRDDLGQYGPDSNRLTIQLDKNSVQSTSESTDGSRHIDSAAVVALKPLNISIKPLQQSLWLGQTIKISYEISGDLAPYSLAFEWGDGSTADLIKKEQAGKYTIEHKYQQAGKNVLRISAFGESGEVASTQTVIIVHQDAIPVTGTINCANYDDGLINRSNINFASICEPPSKAENWITRLAWPSLIASGFMAVSFWIGERVILRRVG